jgi:hypothetical protein
VALLPDAELYERPGESHLGSLGEAEAIIITLLQAWDERTASAPRSGDASQKSSACAA